MRRFISLRSIAGTLMLVSVLFLTSCGTQNQEPVSLGNQEDSSQDSRLSFFDQIPTKYKDDENFLSCARQNLDMCMQEVNFIQEDGALMNCDDFLSEQNRDACRFTQITTQAQSAQDITLCESLDDSSVERCQLEVNMQIAIQSGDTSICENLEGFEMIACNNRIVMEQATRSMDPTLCEGIIAYEGDVENFEKTMCQNQVQYMLDIQTQQEAELQRTALESEQISQEQELQEEVTGLGE